MSLSEWFDPMRCQMHASVGLDVRAALPAGHADDAAAFCADNVAPSSLLRSLPCSPLQMA